MPELGLLALYFTQIPLQTIVIILELLKSKERKGELLFFILFYNFSIPLARIPNVTAQIPIIIPVPTKP